MATNNPAPNAEKNNATIEVASIEKLKSDYDLMLNYAVKIGTSLPKDIELNNSDLNNNDLVANYNNLANAILPSSVESISYINDYIYTKQSIKKWYQVPVYSTLLLISFLALLGVIGFSLFPEVNNENLSKGLLSCSGKTLFVNLLFICSASLLGVMFYSLKSINDKIRSYTLTQIDVLELNSVILIGVISGFLISEVFSTIITSELNNAMILGKMALAILGGFSSDAIFAILHGMVDKIKALFTS